MNLENNRQKIKQSQMDLDMNKSEIELAKTLVLLLYKVNQRL